MVMATTNNKENNMTTTTAADRIREIQDEIEELVYEAKMIQRDKLPDLNANQDAYLWQQLENHLAGVNPYDSSLKTLADEIEKNSSDGQCGECGQDEIEIHEGVCEDCFNRMQDS